MLGKHSGRHGLERRYRELGYELSEEQLAELAIEYKTGARSLPCRQAGQISHDPEIGRVRGVLGSGRQPKTDAAWSRSRCESGTVPLR